MLEFSEEALDQVAIAVEEGAEGEALSSITLCRDVGEAAVAFDPCADSIAVIGLVSQESAAGWYDIKQRYSLAAIAGLSFRQMQADR